MCFRQEYRSSAAADREMLKKCLGRRLVKTHGWTVRHELEQATS